MFKVIRIPTKYSRTINRFTDKQKSELLGALIDIGAGISHTLKDDVVWDTISLIYWDWMRMESKNWIKPEKPLIKYCSESLAPDTASMPPPIVQDNTVQDITIQDNNSKELETEVSETTYWNVDINNMLSLLYKAVWSDTFKETQKVQRQYWKHFVSYINKQGKENFIERLKWVLADDFKAKNCNSIKYLYNEVKSYIYNPALVKEEVKINEV